MSAWVVAPSLIPIKTGDRIKTDRRDATMLAKLHRAGELNAIWVPDLAHEAMRDLVRARATAVRTLGKARQHLQGFLLRHDLLRLRRLCRLGWSAAENAPRRARPAPRRRPDAAGTPLTANASATDYAAHRDALVPPDGAPVLEPKTTLLLKAGFAKLTGCRLGQGLLYGPGTHRANKIPRAG